MDNTHGGQSSGSANSLGSGSQKMTAADLARQKVLDAYREQASLRQGGESVVRTSGGATDKKAENQPHYATTRQSAQSYREGTVGSPMPQAKAAEWQRYHSAWQDYYQKYYGEYYGRAAQEYIAREKMRYERERAETQAKHEAALRQQQGAIVSVATDEMAGEDVQKNIRSKIRDTAAKRAKKVRKSKHFVPLVIGLSILVVGLLFQYNQVILANAVAYISPGGTEVNQIQALDPTVSAKTHEEPTLMIPKLNVEVPVKFGANNDVNSMAVAMNNGVAHFAVPGASALPGQIGNFAISGHSAGNVYQNSDYKFIFSGLTRMVEGDLMYMDYEGKRYSYKVTGTETVNPTDVASLVKIAQDSPDKPMITLITCTPLGTSRYRLLVYGEQIYPSYEGAASAAPGNDEKGDLEMPANDPSPLEQFWKWLTGAN
ncbi:sortase [Candidatus Saccharibacteria bacterium]|nr:sortase [Candidatus Saccharibacteria bacterium]